MARLGMPVSDTTILRSVKKLAGVQPNPAVVRVAAIDEWVWRKGMTFGTVIVDLERRQAVELLADRSAGTAAEWFERHPAIEVVSRDRAGLYADAARQGAPQARQVADRFHLLKNFRDTVKRQLGRFEAPIREAVVQVEDDLGTREQPVIEPSAGCSEVVANERLRRRRRDAARKAMFDEIRVLYEAGSPVTEIARKLGLGPRRVYRWVRRIDLPEPSTMEPKACTPAYFGAFLARRWAEGTTKVRHLISDIRHRGYTGSFSHLARFLAPWRSGSSPSGEAGERPSSDEEAPAPPHVRTLDPTTGRQISPLTAAALCVKPRGQMTDRQKLNVDALKAASCGVHHDAPTGHSLPRAAARRNSRASGRLAERPTHMWYLWNARFCQDLTAGHRGRSQSRAGNLEQWSDGGTDQQAEDAQAGHVWPCRRRLFSFRLYWISFFAVD
jgi:hypothetical protein